MGQARDAPEIEAGATETDLAAGWTKAGVGRVEILRVDDDDAAGTGWRRNVADKADLPVGDGQAELSNERRPAAVRRTSHASDSTSDWASWKSMMTVSFLDVLSINALTSPMQISKKAGSDLPNRK